MITENCAVCGIGGALEGHHVIPRSVGGSDDETNILTVCSCCHGKLHGSNKGKRWNASISALTKAGLQKAKERGVKLGSSKPDIAAMNIGKKNAALARAELHREALEDLRSSGKSMRDIVDKLNKLENPEGLSNKWTLTKVSRVLKRLGIK